MDRLRAFWNVSFILLVAAPSHAQHTATIAIDDFAGGACRLEKISVPLPKGSLPEAREAGVGCTPFGEQRAAVVFVEFPGSAHAAGTKSSVEAMINGPGASTVVNYFREVSFGQAWLTADLIGPVTVAPPATCGDYYGLVDSVVRALDTQVDWRNYNRLVLIIANRPDCGGWLASGTVGCSGVNSPSKGFVSMGLVWLRDALVIKTVTHEIGHTLGLGHAASVEFDNEPVGALDNRGVATEYGNIYSVMGGNSVMGHFDALHKALLGWVNPLVVRSSGSFTLEPWELAPAGGVKSLKVERGRASGKWLWLEYRQPIAPFGIYYGSNLYSGALVHYEDPATNQSRRSELVDFSPGPAPVNLTDAALQAGSTWSDPYSPLTIQVTRAASTGLDLSVRYDETCASPASTALWPAPQAGEYALPVTASTGCQWTAAAAVSWLRVVSGAAGNGPGTVRYAVDANTGTSPRSAWLRIGRQSYPVSQAANCGVRLNPSPSATAVAARSRGTVLVSGGAPGCLFTGGSDAGWLTPQTGTFTGSTAIAYVTRANATSSERAAKFYASGAELRVTQAAPAAPPGARAGVFRAGAWLLNSASATRSGSLGQAGDTPLTGDWTGDGKSKIGIFRPLTSSTAMWLLDANGNGAWDGPSIDRLYIFGQDGDIPLIGDWNGDGRAKIGFFRPLGPTQAMWLLDWNGNGQWEGSLIDRMYFLGQLGDTPLVGDWTGDGMDRIGFFRNGMWLLDANGNGRWDGASLDRLHFIGQAGDTPLVGDWTGEGIARIGFYRAGMWLLDASGDGQWGGTLQDRLHWFGAAADTPVTGDWQASGITRTGLFRNGEWLLDTDGDGVPDRTVNLGRTGDRPQPGQW